MPANNVEGKQPFPQPRISEKKWSKELEAAVYEKWKKEEPYRFDAGAN